MAESVQPTGTRATCAFNISVKFALETRMYNLFVFLSQDSQVDFGHVLSELYRKHACISR